MALNKTLGLVTTTLICAATLVFLVVYRTVVHGGLVEMETSHFEDHVASVQHAIRDRIQQLDSVTSDYGSWDLTYDFMKAHNARYVSSELNDESLRALNVNVFMMLNRGGEIELLKLVGERRQTLSTEQLQKLSRAATRLSRNDIAGGITGVLSGGDPPMLVSIRPILTSRNQGPSRGALVLARFIDERLLQEIGAMTQTPLKIAAPNDAEAAGAGTLQKMPKSITTDGQFGIATILLQDIEHQPAAAIQVSLPRSVFIKIDRAQRNAIILLGLTGVLTALLYQLFVRNRVVRRITALGGLVAEVHRTGNLASRTADTGSDEIAELASSLNQMLSTLQASQAALVQAQKRLQAEATRDSLTGALNRRAGLEALTRELVRCRRQHRTLAVFVLDIDNFKNINDAYGHAAGDAVLRGLTTLLNRTLRPFDSVIRNGGDEFHLIAPGVGVSDALRLGERVLAQVRALHITSGQATLKFTASIGMACCSGELSAEDATAFADRALYRAKANGRDRIELEEAQTEPAADAAWPPEGRTFEVSGERPATVATQ